MSPFLKFVKIISTFCSLIYYFTDNWLWLAQLDFASNTFLGLKIKRIKNLFSLLKTILELFISSFTVHIKRQEEALLVEQLRKYRHEQVEPGKEWYVLMVNLILLRREIRFNCIEAIIYLCRFFLLTSSLKLIGHSLLHPIFVSFSGLL